ncbi:MAG: acetyl-CoA carboxylase biotin carboxyl carrier protein subunit [Bacteroidales bacterium]|nr:acetyl-CoA carboxylase biotin carboxyl carrier protein subunit [Bacteroidales bacterium]
MEEKKIIYKTLNIENIKYKTFLTNKFLLRQQYQKNDLTKITAFIPGKISKIYVKKGRKVKIGDKLLILEAMKMKNDIISSINGIIMQINIKEGDLVTKKDILIELKYLN